MRARLVVSSVLVASCIGIESIVSVVHAQTPNAAPPATPTSPATPPTAAPAPPAAAPPAAAPPAAAVPAAPAASQPPAEGFNLSAALRGTGAPLTADEAAKRAAKTAPSVSRAEAASRRAAIAAEQANVAVYPRLELEARYTLMSEVPVPEALEATPFAESFESQQHTGLLQARLSYPVSSLFFSILPRHKAALKNAEAQRLQSRIEAQSVSLRAREAYYNYARARAALMVARSAQAQAEAHRRDVDALVTAGSLAKVELMRADAQVAAAKVAVSRTQGSVAISRNALYTLAHLEGTEDATINEDLEQELPALTDNTDSLLAKALSNRSELKQLRISLQALEHGVDAAQGQQLPQFLVGAQAEYSNPNQRYFGEPNTWNPSWAVYAALTWSPNDWAESDKVADQTRADLAQTLSDLEALEDALRVEVTQAYEDYNAARAALESSRAGIAAAEESYRVRREQFRAGAAVATDVIDAEAELRQARLDLVNAIIDMRIAKSRLDRAIEAA